MKNAQAIANIVRNLVKGLITMDEVEAESRELAEETRKLMSKNDGLEMYSDDYLTNLDTIHLNLSQQCAILDTFRMFPLVMAMIRADERKGIATIQDGNWTALIEAIGGSRSEHGAVSRVAKLRLRGQY